MSRYTGPRFRVVRKLGSTLPGFCTRRSNRADKSPGQHGKVKPNRFQKRRLSAYRLRLMEKQKLRFNYHVTEKQLFNYVKKARRMTGPTGGNLLVLLEMRLDTIVYRMAMAKTIVAARQLVSHGHITVNARKLTIPSYECKIMDTVGVKKDKGSRKLVRSAMKSVTSEPGTLAVAPKKKKTTLTLGKKKRKKKSESATGNTRKMKKKSGRLGKKKSSTQKMKKKTGRLEQNDRRTLSGRGRLGRFSGRGSAGRSGTTRTVVGRGESFGRASGRFGRTDGRFGRTGGRFGRTGGRFSGGNRNRGKRTGFRSASSLAVFSDKTYKYYKIPNYLKVSRKALTGVVKNLVPRRQVRLAVNERLVVEYYSRS